MAVLAVTGNIVPPEVIDIISNYVADSSNDSHYFNKEATLRSSALVCKAFCHSTQRHIFRRLTLGLSRSFDRRTKQLCKVLRGRPDLLELVRSLTILYDDSRGRNFSKTSASRTPNGPLLEVIRRFRDRRSPPRQALKLLSKANIEILGLEGMDWSSLPEDITNALFSLRAIPTLTTLQLVQMWNLNIDFITGGCKTENQITHLEIVNVFCVSNSRNPVVAFSDCVRSLAVGGHFILSGAERDVSPAFSIPKLAIRCENLEKFSISCRPNDPDKTWTSQWQALYSARASLEKLEVIDIGYADIELALPRLVHISDLTALTTLTIKERERSKLHWGTQSNNTRVNGITELLKTANAACNLRTIVLNLNQKIRRMHEVELGVLASKRWTGFDDVVTSDYFLSLVEVRLEMEIVCVGMRGRVCEVRKWADGFGSNGQAILPKTSAHPRIQLAVRVHLSFDYRF